VKPDAPILRLEGVSKTYRDGESDVRALSDVTFDLGYGELVSVAGVSGSGKTTLLGVISGIIAPDSGQLQFGDRDLTSSDDATRAHLRGSEMGVILQRGNLIPFLTIRENIELVATLTSDPESIDEGIRWIEHLGLADRLDDRPRHLSGGEVQRAAVALALANRPSVLLADEATAELDGATAREVMGLFETLWRERGLSVLYVTHDQSLAARAKRRLELVDGAVRSI
jgi:putative ABC transport system ATP-binding protein